MGMVAGHTFVERLEGRICANCGQLWTAISGVTKQDIGKTGFAHQGSLTENEYQQIVDERERIWRIAMGSVAIPKG